MRYDDAPRTERAPTTPTKALEIRVLRVKRLMNLSSGVSVGVSIHQSRVWHCFFTPNDLPGSADVPSAIVAADHRSGLQPLRWSFYIWPPFFQGDAASFAARGLRFVCITPPSLRGGRQSTRLRRGNEAGQQRRQSYLQSLSTAGSLTQRWQGIQQWLRGLDSLSAFSTDWRSSSPRLRKDLVLLWKAAMDRSFQS